VLWDRNWGWLCKMTKFLHSASKLSTACTLGNFVGKESHFKIYVYAPVKPGNYETPPTKPLDWPSHWLRHSQIYIKMLQPHSWSTSFARNYFECSLEDMQNKCDDIMLDLWAERMEWAKVVGNNLIISLINIYVCTYHMLCICMTYTSHSCLN